MVLVIIIGILVGVGILLLTPVGDIVEQYAGIDIPDVDYKKLGVGDQLSENGLKNNIYAGFDWLGDVLKGQVQKSDLENQNNPLKTTNEEATSAIESGVIVGKETTDVFFALHKFIVDLIFAGSPIPIEYALIALIAGGISIFVVLKWLGRTAKQTALVIIGIIFIVMIMVSLGVNPNP